MTAVVPLAIAEALEPRPSKRQELSLLFKLAVPIMITMTSQQGMVLTDQVCGTLT